MRFQVASSCSNMRSSSASESFFAAGKRKTSDSSEVDSHGICAPPDASRTLSRTRLNASSMRAPRTASSRTRLSVYSPCLPGPSDATAPGAVENASTVPAGASNGLKPRRSGWNAAPSGLSRQASRITTNTLFRVFASCSSSTPRSKQRGASSFAEATFASTGTR